MNGNIEPATGFLDPAKLWSVYYMFLFTAFWKSLQVHEISLLWQKKDVEMFLFI